jgi:hypothetical protein
VTENNHPRPVLIGTNFHLPAVLSQWPSKTAAFPLAITDLDFQRLELQPQHEKCLSCFLPFARFIRARQSVAG